MRAPTFAFLALATFATTARAEGIKGGDGGVDVRYQDLFTHYAARVSVDERRVALQKESSNSMDGVQVVDTVCAADGTCQTYFELMGDGGSDPDAAERFAADTGEATPVRLTRVRSTKGRLGAIRVRLARGKLVVRHRGAVVATTPAPADQGLVALGLTPAGRLVVVFARSARIIDL